MDTQWALLSIRIVIEFELEKIEFLQGFESELQTEKLTLSQIVMEKLRNYKNDYLYWKGDPFPLRLLNRLKRERERERERERKKRERERFKRTTSDQS